MARARKQPTTQAEILSFLHQVADKEGWVQSYNGRARLHWATGKESSGCMCGCGGTYSETDRAVSGMFNRVDEMLRNDFSRLTEVDAHKETGKNYIIIVANGRVYGLYSSI
jgi:hypothetical protein